MCTVCKWIVIKPAVYFLGRVLKSDVACVFVRICVAEYVVWWIVPTCVDTAGSLV
jgi:hypothetical protein